jgi:hypothetical protein
LSTTPNDAAVVFSIAVPITLRAVVDHSFILEPQSQRKTETTIKPDLNGREKEKGCVRVKQGWKVKKQLKKRGTYLARKENRLPNRHQPHFFQPNTEIP